MFTLTESRTTSRKIQRLLQAIGVLLAEEFDQTASKLRIPKLLYIADREAIRETGDSLFRLKTLALDHGPAHGEALDLLNGQHVAEPDFADSFERRNYRVRMRKGPGVGALSKYEIAKLQEVSRRYADFSDWGLAHDITQAFDEWQQHRRAGTSATIPLAAIARAASRAADEPAILQDASNAEKFDRVFGDA